VVTCVGGVGVNQPEGVKICREESSRGGDIEGEDLIHNFEPREDRNGSKERHVNIGRYTWLPDMGKKGLKPLKEGRRALLTGGSWRRTNERYVVASLNDAYFLVIFLFFSFVFAMMRDLV